MYKIKHIQFTVEDTIDNLDKILAHPNILVKEFQRQILWTNFELIKRDNYKSHDNITSVSIDCYLKVKHSRRFKEILETPWIVSVKDVLLVIK